MSYGSNSEIKLFQLGERKIINTIAKITETDISDDCAKIDIGKKSIVVTTDSISEAKHIPDYADHYLIGWHVVAVNLSDIAAKGGKPVGIFIAYLLPSNYAVNKLKKLAKGVKDCAKLNNVLVLGGDTKESKSLSICGTAIGFVNSENYMHRKGLKVNDLVLVTGYLGKSAYALKTKNAELLLKIMPRITEGIQLGKSGIVNSCMDISDGLVESLYQLSDLCCFGFQIHTEKLPIYNGSDLEAGLYTGGDYELLFTIDKKNLQLIEKFNFPISCIGKVIKKRFVVNERNEILPRKGYEHFKKKC